MRTSYFGLRKEIVQALFLIAIVILVFLQSVRGTLIVAVAIPLSFAVTLIVLYATGQTLNAFTLGGLTLAMGRARRSMRSSCWNQSTATRSSGMSTAEAALHGTNAVALAGARLDAHAPWPCSCRCCSWPAWRKKLFAPLALTVAVAHDRRPTSSACA